MLSMYLPNTMKLTTPSDVTGQGYSTVLIGVAEKPQFVHLSMHVGTRALLLSLLACFPGIIPFEKHRQNPPDTELLELHLDTAAVQ